MASEAACCLFVRDIQLHTTAAVAGQRSVIFKRGALAPEEITCGAAVIWGPGYSGVDGTEQGHNRDRCFQFNYLREITFY